MKIVDSDSVNMNCFKNSKCVVLLFVGVYVLLTIDSVTALLEEDKAPTYLTVDVGEHITFNCPLDFPQDIEIPFVLHWKKDNREVFSFYDGVLSVAEPFQGRISLVDTSITDNIEYGRGSVNITNIRETDAGWYECKVIFPNRTPVSKPNGTWFHLTVGGNLLAIPPMNQTVMEGEEANFPCVTKKPNTPVDWFKDGRPLSEFTDLSHRSWQTEDGSLTINPTIMTDLGEYECKATSDTGEIQTARAYLNVQYKAKVIYAPAEVFFAYGREAILNCHYRANPPMKNLRWIKDGYLFDPYNVKGVFYRRNGSLYFSSVDETHNGRYSCTPYNDLGTEGPSPLIHVIVRKPPVFTVKPLNIYLAKLGDTVDMHCDAVDGDSVHKPMLMWKRKDDAALPYGRFSIQGGNISIEHIEEEDRGIYECIAKNEAASIVAETEINVENVPPRAPYNLTANSSQTEVTVRWVPGYMRPRLEYSVWYRQTDSAEWRTKRVLSSKSTEVNIDNLNPGREYEFMVLSQDRHGDGMFSKPLRIYTKSTAGYGDAEEYRSTVGMFQQIGPPVNVSVDLTPEGYIVSWDPPVFGRDQLRTYIVRWTQGESHHEFLAGTAETKNTYHLLPDLEEDEVYNFQVLSLSKDDYQAASSKYTMKVPAYRRIRAISIGVVVAVAFLGLAFAAVIYGRKKFCKEYTSTPERNGKK